MNKVIKYIVFTLIIGVSLFFSVNIQSLDQHKKGENKGVFDAKSFASNFMTTKVVTLTAIPASEFLENCSKDLTKYCNEKGKKLGISDNYNFIIDGKATVTAIEDENVVLAVNNNKEQQIRIATDFIFGNAIRDGSTIANIGDFQNTMDFNTISVELNNIIRETIVPPFVKRVRLGDQLYFKGAVKVNDKNPDLQNLKVIPLLIKFNN